MILAASASFIALAPEHWAFAQQNTQAAPSTSTGLEEIVVTARRREEKLQSVPIAITAFSEDSLQQKSVTAVQDLQYSVPSLSVLGQNRDEANFNLRGIGAGPIGAGDRTIQSVATYFDQVATTQAGPGVFYDLENVQVLKGPQGTLFGRNSTGGAVLFEPRKPTNDFEGYIQAQLGNYNDEEFEGALNVPIVQDKLLLRVSGNLARRDGYTQNVPTNQDLDDRNYDAWRVSLTWRPTDDFENAVVYNGLFKDQNGSSHVPYYLNPGAVISTLSIPGFGNFNITLGNGPGVAGLSGPNAAAVFFAGIAAGNQFSLVPSSNYGSILARQQAAGIRTEFTDVRGRDKEYNWEVVDIATYDVADNIKLKNIFGYQSNKTLGAFDYAGTVLPLLRVINSDSDGWTSNIEQITDEFQVQGKSLGGNLTWIVGAYGEFVHPGGTWQILSNQLGTPGARINHQTDLSRALFAQADYDFGGVVDALSGLKLTLGYRYTWDNRSESSVTYNFPHTCTQGIAPSCVVAGNTQFHAPSWTLGLNYQITPETLVYVTSRRGYQSGGFNLPAPSPQTEIYRPEYVTDVEIGLKSDWDVDGVKFRTNADYYHSWFTNIQEEAGIVNPVTHGVTTGIENAATATIDGFEFEGTVVPITDVTLTAFYSFSQATFGTYQSATYGDLSNTQFFFVPKNKWGISAQYHLPLDEAVGDLSITANYSYQEHTTSATPADPVFGTIPGYGLLNLSVDWTNIYRQPVDVSFFMSNALDKAYYLGGFPIDSLGFGSALYGEPRMFGFRLKYRFGGPAEEPEAAPAAYVPPPVVAPAAPKSYLVFFDFNKSDLTPEGTTIVDTAAKNAGPAKVTQLTVTGHTDTVGSDAYNMRLSRRRAESVAAQLEKDGIPSSEIEIVAKGKRDLLVPTADGVKEPQNRRVQIVYSSGPTS
jgi:iron complex outermembrane receptor protein